MTKIKVMKQVTEKEIYRAVASSTAIEVGIAVKEIEEKLKARKSKFKNFELA